MRARVASIVAGEERSSASRRGDWRERLPARRSRALSCLARSGLGTLCRPSSGWPKSCASDLYSTGLGGRCSLPPLSDVHGVGRSDSDCLPATRRETDTVSSDPRARYSAPDEWRACTTLEPQELGRDAAPHCHRRASAGSAQQLPVGGARPRRRLCVLTCRRLACWFRDRPVAISATRLGHEGRDSGYALHASAAERCACARSPSGLQLRQVRRGWARLGRRQRQRQCLRLRPRRFTRRRG